MDKKDWKAKDIFISIIIIIFLNIIAALILSEDTDYIFSYGITALIDLIAIYLLNTKYPLKLILPNDKQILIKYIFVGVAVCMMIDFPYSIWSGNFHSLPDQYSIFIKYQFIEKILFLVLLCLVVPFVEEILFRGFIYRVLKNRYNITFGAITSIAIFTVFHGFEVSNLYYVAIPAFVYVYVYEKSKSLWTSIATHSLNNTLWFGFIYWGIQS